MVWLLLQVVVVFTLFATPRLPVHAQEADPPVQRHYEFVSGSISELPPGKIVVNRAVLGKPAENRTFLITSETKIEGRLRVKARVTVGFKPTNEGDVAMRIIVR
jgi:hypothetical protein